jgi:hypothetical protein
MNPPTGPAAPSARRLPPGVAPGTGMPAAAQPPCGQARPGPPVTRPAAPVLRALADLLGQHGLTHLYGAADKDLGVLSLPRVTVWCYGHTLTWTHRGQATTMPAADITIAATLLATLAARPRLRRPADRASGQARSEFAASQRNHLQQEES